MPQIADSNRFSEWEMVFHTPSEQAAELYFSLESAGHQVCHRPDPVQRSGFGNYVLIYTAGGQDRLLYEGAAYPLSKGDFFFIDGNQPHAYGFTGCWEYYWVSFKGQNAALFYKQFRELADGVVAGLPYGPEFTGMVRHILELKAHEDMYFDPRMSAMLYKALADLMILLKSTHMQARWGSAREGIAGALDYIHGHYQENISLSDVAAHVYLDKYHLVRVFKAATGYTPYEYLLNLRIDKSKPLLLYTAERVEDIARMVGFSNASCFISAFKRREGKTPLKYRSTGG